MAPQSTKTRARNIRTAVRYGLIIAAVTATLTAGIYTSQKFQQFMIRDPRFFLPGPADYGMESQNLTVNGIQYASRTRILRLFEQDYGRSLYLFPLAARRKSLLAVSWVHDASIARVWPNRIVVTISERTPVAFIKVPAGGIVRWALIDDEGVILEPPQRAPFRLPVLAGVSPDESQDQRAQRVRRMQHLMKELGGLANKVSEVDANDLDDLRISQQVQGRSVSLMLGNQNFSSRLENFLSHYQDIHRKMPRSTTFDLRLDDRITALEEKDSGR